MTATDLKQAIDNYARTQGIKAKTRIVHDNIVDGNFQLGNNQLHHTWYINLLNRTTRPRQAVRTHIATIARFLR